MENLTELYKTIMENISNILVAKIAAISSNIDLAVKTLKDPWEENPFRKDEKIQEALGYLEKAKNACAMAAENVKKIAVTDETQ